MIYLYSSIAYVSSHGVWSDFLRIWIVWCSMPKFIDFSVVHSALSHCFLSIKLNGIYWLSKIFELFCCCSLRNLWSTGLPDQIASRRYSIRWIALFNCSTKLDIDIWPYKHSHKTNQQSNVDIVHFQPLITKCFRLDVVSKFNGFIAA